MARFGWLVVVLAMLPHPALSEGATDMGWSSASTRDEEKLPAFLATPLEQGILLEWDVPTPEVSSGAGGLSRITVDGFEDSGAPGESALPEATILVALPPGADPSLVIDVIEELDLHLPTPLTIVPQPKPQVLPGSASVNSPYAGDSDEVFQETSRDLWPVPPARNAAHQTVRWEEAGIARGVRLARVIFSPVRVLDPGSLKARVAVRVKATLQFNLPPQAGASYIPLNGGDAFHEILRGMVANPDGVIQSPRTEWGKSAPAYVYQDIPGEGAQDVFAGEIALPALAVVEVSENGLTALTSDNLASAGLSPGEINPAYLGLYRDGLPVAAVWEGDQDGMFEPGERLLFYADLRPSRYTNIDTYFLRLDSYPSLRAKEINASPAGRSTAAVEVQVTAEQNLLYTPNCNCGKLPAGRDGDRWVWHALHLPASPQAVFPVDLPAADPSRPAVLSVWLVGYTTSPVNPDHRVQVSLNGATLGHVEWDGRQLVEASFPVEAGVLRAGKNELTLGLPGIPGNTVEGVWLDSFSVRYLLNPAALHLPSGGRLNFSLPAGGGSSTLKVQDPTVYLFDVSEPTKPVRLVGVEYGMEGEVSFGLTSASSPSLFASSMGGVLQPIRVRSFASMDMDPGGATYLILTPAAFRPALESLEVHRTLQGYSTTVIELEAVYDHFGGGRSEPAAIRNMLEWAYSSWDTQPLYLLLVGDGSYDPKQYLPTSSPTYLPALLEQVDPWAGETASDNRYVTLEGQDNLPDMLVGRLPVSSLEETRAVVDKIVAYDQSPAAGPWAAMATLVADNPDMSGDFHSLAERAALPLTQVPLLLERIYHRSESAVPGSNAASRSAVRSAWDAGRLAIVYAGHASVHQWAAENFLHLDEAGVLHNEGRLPVLVSLTCFTSSFHLPGFQALDEALLLNRNGGVIAAWGSTGLGVATGHAPLAEGFLQSAFAEEGSTLGLSVLAGKLNLAARRPVFADLIDTYTLLGDPLTRTNPAYQELPAFTYLPLLSR